MSAEPFEPHWVQRPGARVAAVHRATTIKEALQALVEDPTRRLVSGGTDLVLELDRTPGPDVELIDISGIAAYLLDMTPGDHHALPHARPGWEPAPHGHLVLGAGATHNDVVSHAGVVQSALPLAQACLEVGSPQLRNRATIAGNLVTASPANDTISALLALNASVAVVGLVDDEMTWRQVPVADFVTGFRQTMLAPNELIESIWIPKMGSSERGVWVKAGLRAAQAISVVHAGVWLRFDDADPTVVADARISLGSVAATVVLSEGARAALVGRPLDQDSIDAAAQAAAGGVSPIDDGRATAEYRVETVATVVRRALATLAADGQAVRWPARVPTLGRTERPAWPQRSGVADGVVTIDDSTEVQVTINGASTTAAGAGSVTLLDWLRDQAGTGTKEGCAEGECGACTVLIDGTAVMSCLTPAAQAAGTSITTVEGLASPDALSAMQQSFVDNFAVQCGYCIPGFVVAATALRSEIDDPDRSEIELGLSGNLCRCTGYYTILEAVRTAGVEVPVVSS